MKHLIKALIFTLCLCSLSLATTPASKVELDILLKSQQQSHVPLTKDIVEEDSTKSTQEWISDKAQELLNEVRTLLTLPEAMPTLKINKEQLKAVSVEPKTNNTARTKRQLAVGGGFGLGFGAYDYNDYYGDYVGDYAYDYYDWICTDTACQLCDILTSECCDPDIDINCYLPDSCMNNPCLSGGTCITSRTIDNRPDFVCACLPGLTGKYCQLANDYFVGAEAALAAAPAIPRMPFGGMTGPAAPAAPVMTSYNGYGAAPAAAAPSYGGYAQPAAAASSYGSYAQPAASSYGSYAQPAAAAAPSYGSYAQPAASSYGSYAQPAAAAAPSYGGYSAPTAAAPAQSYGGYGQAAAAAPAAGYGATQQLSYRGKRSLEGEMQEFVSEYQKLLLTLQSDDEFKFTCDTNGMGESRFVLFENGTKSDEKYCQCFDKSFGTNCAKSTTVNCDGDSSRRTTAGHYVPRQYFVECTGHMPNVIKCSEGKIYDKESKQCIKHALKKQPVF